MLIGPDTGLSRTGQKRRERSACGAFGRPRHELTCGRLGGRGFWQRRHLGLADTTGLFAEQRRDAALGRSRVAHGGIRPARDLGRRHGVSGLQRSRPLGASHACRPFAIRPVRVRPAMSAPRGALATRTACWQATDPAGRLRARREAPSSTEGGPATREGRTGLYRERGSQAPGCAHASKLIADVGRWCLAQRSALDESPGA